MCFKNRTTQDLRWWRFLYESRPTQGKKVVHSQPFSSGCSRTIPHGRPSSFGRRCPPCGRPCTIPHAGCPRCCRPPTAGRARSPTAGRPCLDPPRPASSFVHGHPSPWPAAKHTRRSLFSAVSPPRPAVHDPLSAGYPCLAMVVPPTAGRARSPTAGRPCLDPP